MLASLSSTAKEAIPALIELLQHNDSRVRLDAATVLTHMGPAAKEAIPVLTKLLQDNDPEVRVAAASTLENVRKQTPAKP